MLSLSYPLFELSLLFRSEGIRLGDDRDDVDRSTQVLHELYIQLPQPKTEKESK